MHYNKNVEKKYESKRVKTEKITAEYQQVLATSAPSTKSQERQRKKNGQREKIRIREEVTYIRALDCVEDKRAGRNSPRSTSTTKPRVKTDGTKKKRYFN